jgi:AcrR family transcriptional regulator
VASSPNTAERPRAAHLGPEVRRPLVLDAAMEVFLEHGFEGASMEAIARAAGVSKPVVYDCFVSKDELFKALFQREEKRVMEEVQRALPEEATAKGAEAAIAEGITAFLRAVAEAPKSYRVVLLGEGGMNASVARRVRAGRRQQVEAAAEAARTRLDPEGKMDERDARFFGEMLVGVSEAGARALIAGDSEWTPEELGPRLAKVVVAALPSG